MASLDHMVLQPVVRLTDRHVMGYEALARFEDSKPETAFTQARLEGSVVDLDLACIAAALKFLPELEPSLWLGVNVLTETLADFRLLSLLLDNGVPPDRLVLEISEQTPMEMLEVYRPMRRLRERGVLFAIDDVGKGYADLNRIAQMLPDFIKVDATFVRDIDARLVSRAVVSALVQLSHELRATVAAEGVETEAEHDFLVALGVRLGQGWLYGREERPAPSRAL